MGLMKEFLRSIRSKLGSDTESHMDKLRRRIKQNGDLTPEVDVALSILEFRQDEAIKKTSTNAVEPMLFAPKPETYPSELSYNLAHALGVLHYARSHWNRSEWSSRQIDQLNEAEFDILDSTSERKQKEKTKKLQQKISRLLSEIELELEPDFASQLLSRLAASVEKNGSFLSADQSNLVLQTSYTLLEMSERLREARNESIVSQTTRKKLIMGEEHSIRETTTPIESGSAAHKALLSEYNIGDILEAVEKIIVHVEYIPKSTVEK